MCEVVVKQLYWKPLYWNDLLGIKDDDDDVPLQKEEKEEKEEKEYRPLIVPLPPTKAETTATTAKKITTKTTTKTTKSRAPKVPVPSHKKNVKYLNSRQKNTQSAQRWRASSKELDDYRIVRMQTAMDLKKALEEEKKVLEQKMDNFRALFRLLGYR